MKRTITLLAAAAVLITACEKEVKPVAVESVSVTPTTLSLTEGESGTLKAAVLPQNADDKTVSWSSSDTGVATVADGKVTAVKAGTATITAMAGGKSGSCTVTVTAATVAVTNISLDVTEKALMKGETLQLTATVEPADATDKTVSWTTSDAAIATVENGLVTAVAEGEATITAAAGGKEASCAITVLSTTPKMVDLGLSVLWADRNLGATSPTGLGEFYAWGETESKETYGWENYKWGTAEAISKYNLEDNIRILEKEDDASSALLGEKWRMPLVSEFEELLGTKNKENYKWVWKTVDGHNGWEITYLTNNNSIFLPITGKSPKHNGDDSKGFYWTSVWSLGLDLADHVVLTDDVSYYYPYAYRSWGMAVRPVFGDLPAPKAIMLNMNKATRYLNGVVYLRASIYPKNAVNQKVTWSSSNEAVATVDDYGYVTVVSEGETTITVKTQDGGITDQCVVTVVPTPSDALSSWGDFNSSTSDAPLLILQNNWDGEYTLTRPNGTVDLNGHWIYILNMRNNDPEQSVTVRRGIFSKRLDGGQAWGSNVYRGKVILEDIDFPAGLYNEFYTDGHVYEIRGGYYSTVTTYRVGEALGDVHIYDGTFDRFWDVNPDAGSNQGEFYLYGGKFAFDPRDYKNPGQNPAAQTIINIVEGYSVKENPNADKVDFPYIVTKD